MAAGNIYRHDYDRAAENRVWRTVAQSLPPMIAVVQQEVEALD